MPSVLSKDLSSRILGKEWSFGYNCYEVGHTWTPSCTDAALEISTAAAMNILPLYAILYSFTQLVVHRKYDLDSTSETIKSILRSSFFIFFHAYNGAAFGCALRRSFGRFYFRVLVCAPALASSYLALLIEKPARRQALAFYMLNLASEIVFRMMVTKGYFRPINHGETLLFATSLAAWYYLIKSNGFGRDPISVAMKILIGRDEACQSARTSRRMLASHDNKVSDMERQGGAKSLLPARKVEESVNIISNQLEVLSRKYGNLLDYLGSNWLNLNKYTCCPHQESTCLRYSLQPLPSRLLLGYSLQTLLKLSSKPLQLIQNPLATVKQTLLARNSLNFGLFLATMVSSGRLTNCLLRRYSQSNDCSWHGLVSGFIAGLSMFWSPRSSLSMYVMWKAIEQYYLLAANQGKVAYFNFTILSVYSFSAATILYTFTMEPRFVRPSYMKFLDNLSDHRLHQINRMVLDVFGTGSSVGYEDYFPDLHPKYMSNQFKELIFNWMIQPY